MSTTAEVNPELAQKESPGDGKHKPQHHIVRIVVVRDAGSPETPDRAANESHGPAHESHGLTDEKLKNAQDQLKKMPPPHSSEESTPAAKNMLEALEPTDIVVVGKEAASVRVIAEEGVGGTATRRTKRLAAHDDRHRDTVLKVWTESDTVEYQCEHKFAIVEVQQANWRIHGAPPNLFERERGSMPYEAREEPPTTGPAGNPKPVWTWTSGTVPKSANNQQYKMSFMIKIGDRDELVDPDVVCGDPPPGN
jgi:hypothetical protein